MYINKTTRHLNESVEDLQESKYSKILNVLLFYLYFVTFNIQRQLILKLLKEICYLVKILLKFKIILL